MEFHFKYENRAVDLWKLAMYSTYRSLVGLINIVFTFAMVMLTIRFFGEASPLIRLLLLLGIALFLVIQPYLVYLRARKQVSALAKHMEMTVDDRGIYIRTEQKSSRIKWRSVRGVYRNRSMLVIYSAANQGFILSNQTLGDQKEALYDYVNAMTQKK